MSVPRAVLRRLEGRLGSVVNLVDGRKGTLRVVDACGNKLSFCVELQDGRLVWLDSDELLIPEKDATRFSAAEGQ